MGPKKTLKDDVELALRVLHEKIDSLKAQIDKLCETTGECEIIEKAPELAKEKK
jgi:prefoldin subunit 5